MCIRDSGCNPIRLDRIERVSIKSDIGIQVSEDNRNGERVAISRVAVGAEGRGTSEEEGRGQVSLSRPTLSKLFRLSTSIQSAHLLPRHERLLRLCWDLG